MKSSPFWKRRAFKVIAGCVALSALAIVMGIATIDRWLFVALAPGPFDTATTPTAPDYEKMSEWAAHPTTPDAAERTVAALPAPSPTQAPTKGTQPEVFYVHPTTSLSSTWNATTQDAVVIQATARGGTLIQASVFNACCAIYAPRYRQAHGTAFVTQSSDGDKAIAVALGDVERAFDVFLAAIGDAPFILAGHSQGAILLDKLIEQRIAKTPLVDRLIVAYLPGAPIREGKHALPKCRDASATGCLVSWHARGPRYVANGLELSADVDDTMRNRVCVNPISWRTPSAAPFVGVKTPKDESLGAVFLDGEAPKLLPGFLTAQCNAGSLVVDDLGPLDRDFMSRLLLFLTGPDNFHPIEYQLFYADIRANVKTRIDAHRRRHQATEDASQSRH